MQHDKDIQNEELKHTSQLNIVVGNSWVCQETPIVRLECHLHESSVVKS